MKRRFHDLLTRYAFIRRATEAERTAHTPNPIKLLRLVRLRHAAERNIRAFIAQSAIRRASRPRFQPALKPMRPARQQFAHAT